MSETTRGSWTIVVLGRPGEEARELRIHPFVRALIAVCVLLTGAAAAAGYRFAAGLPGMDRAAATTNRATTKGGDALPAPAPASPAERTQARPDTRARQPPQAPQPGAAPASAALAQGAGTPEPPATGTPLRYFESAGSSAVLEVVPFDAQGRPRDSAFEQLSKALACGDGRGVTPDAKLVQLLLRAQQEFERPLMLLGGRCAAHRDHPGAGAEHRAGRAADIRLRGVSSERLSEWAIEEGAAGVGRYRAQGLLHVDVRSGSKERWEPEPPTRAAREHRKRNADDADDGTEAKVDESAREHTSTHAAAAKAADAPAPVPAAAPSANDAIDEAPSANDGAGDSADDSASEPTPAAPSTPESEAPAPLAKPEQAKTDRDDTKPPKSAAQAQADVSRDARIAYP